MLQKVPKEVVVTFEVGVRRISDFFAAGVHVSDSLNSVIFVLIIIVPVIRLIVFVSEIYSAMLLLLLAISLLVHFGCVIRRRHFVHR